MKLTKSKCTALATFSALLLMQVSSQAASVLLLTDNFNTANNTDLNLNLASRQDGTLKSTGGAAPAGSTWTKFASGGTIVSNQLNVPGGGGVRNNADFEPALTSVDLSAVSGFTMSFNLQYTGATNQWTSPYLSTHTGDERAQSRFGFVAFGNGNLQFYGGAVTGGQVNTGVSNATLATLVSGWSINNQNSYSLVATRTTATTGTYDAFINGIQVASNIAYGFGTGGDSGEVNFEIINTATGAGLYDNFSLVTVPEPSAALLGALGTLILLRRRRN
ncbi:PEP-CTERM sorting domain-containing protein [Akkermansiaceae bacterium]|nr:PEP-CTERM sorting domain-containing protein [Akkermansiaceae bacterium]